MDPKLAASIASFATRFCNEQEQNRSSVCSPLSAQSVLALTALGCAGASRIELLAAMDLRDDDAVRTSFSFITSKLKSVEGVTLKMANRVYMNNNGTLKPAIKMDAEETFDSGLEMLDFTDKTAAADMINEWVAEQTAGKISHVVSPETLGEVLETGLVLLNASYFKGFWERQFPRELTKNREFYLDNTTEIKVPMMCMKEKRFCYKHCPELKAQLLQLYYEGRQSSMVIVLPDEVEGLGDVTQQLADGYDLMEELAGLSSTHIDVLKIPKFDVETRIDMKQVLPKMGIKTIFDRRKSNIQMLTSEQRLFVTQALQKAVIMVDESGTEVEAASSSTHHDAKFCKLIAIRRLKFIANRPFLYILMAGQIPLFLGIYQGREFAVGPSRTLSKVPVNKICRRDERKTYYLETH